MRNIEEVYEALDGAKLCQKVEYEGQIVGLIVWHGGHTLNFFNTEGKNTDVRSFGNFIYSEVSFTEAFQEMAQWAADLNDEISAHDEP